MSTTRGVTPEIGDALAAYLKAMHAANVPAGTIKQYRMVVRRLATRYAGRHFGGITTKDLADFLYGEEGILVGRSSQTATSYRAALRSFFAFGALRGWTRTATAVPQPVFKQRGKPRVFAPTRLKEAELLLLIDRAESPVLRAMIAVAIGTALRICDVRKIKRSEVDFQTADLYIWIQKTGKFDAFPISLDLEEELRRYLVWYSTTVSAEHSGPYLFPGWRKVGFGVGNWEPDASKFISYSWAGERLKALYAECGIHVEGREVWHTIRRSVARIYFDRLRTEMNHDHALRQTMALLGHTKQETTERYLGLQAEILARNESLRGKRFLHRDRTVTPLKQAR